MYSQGLLVWTERPSETCRVIISKLEKVVRLVVLL